MTKEQFFYELKKKLHSLPEEERRQMLTVYENLFQQAMTSGKSEQDVVRSLGYAHLYGEAPGIGGPLPTPPEWGRQPENGLRAILASLALGLFNLIFLVGPFIAVAAALFSLTVAGAVLAISPILLLIGSGIPADSQTLRFEVFLAMAGTGLGVLLLIGLWYLIRGFFTIVGKYVKLNIRLIKGE